MSVKIQKGRPKNLPFICGIYKITSPTGKIYIGQSYDVLMTWKTRYKNPKRCEGQVLIHRSLVKHGVENHKFEIIHTCSSDISQEDIDSLEKNYIFLFDTFETPHGLNLTEGGANGRLSEQTKKKQSESSKGKPKSESHRENLRKANLGKKHSEDTKSKMSKSHTGKQVSDSMRQKCRETKLGDKNPSFGKSPSDETRQKQRETNKRIGLKPPVNRGEANFKSRMVLNTETGIYYASITEAWLSFGKKSNACFANKLKGKVKNNTSYILV